MSEIVTNKITTNKAQAGFTLVELAIVLVIIGLIVSSVLVGKDLIKASQLRATIRQQAEFQLAVNTFIGKYNGIPGDLINATSYGFISNGNGDRIIESNGGFVATFQGEISTFWQNLTTPGKELIPGSYSGTLCLTACVAGTDYPALKFGQTGWGVYGIPPIAAFAAYPNIGNNYFVTGLQVNNGINDNMYVYTDFTPEEAFNIDSKIDDGIPASGSVMGVQVTNPAYFLGGIGAAAACGTTAYATGTTQTPTCALQFLMQTF